MVRIYFKKKKKESVENAVVEIYWNNETIGNAVMGISCEIKK